MGLETGTYVSDLVTTNPVSNDKKSQGDDHLRLIKSALAATLPNASKAFRFPVVSAKTADYVVLSTDDNSLLTVDTTAGAVALTLPTLTSSDDGWKLRVLKTSADTNAVTVTATINGETNYVITSEYGSAIFEWDGSNWFAHSENEITALLSLSTPDAADSVRVYDVSANRQKTSTIAEFFTSIDTLTADATPDEAADYMVSYDASAAAAKKVKLSDIPNSTPRGYIDGCALSNNATDTTNDIDIAAGICRDSTNAVDIELSAITGKQLDANWAAGGSAGMRNSAAGIADGTYHLYAVRTAASATGDIYAYAGVAGTDPDSAAAISTMLTALQAETGGGSYAYARRIGSIIRSSSAILPFVQKGDKFLFKTPVLDESAATVPSTAALITLTVPLGPKVSPYVTIGSQNTDTARGVYLSSPDQTDAAPSYSAAPLVDLYQNANYTGWAQVDRLLTDNNGRIRWRAGIGVTVGTVYLATNGWDDLRGKDN